MSVIFKFENITSKSKTQNIAILNISLIFEDIVRGMYYIVNDVDATKSSS